MHAGICTIAVSTCKDSFHSVLTHGYVLMCVQLCVCVCAALGTGPLQARKDWFFIAMPNAMGVAFNTVSLLLCALLPARERQASTAAKRSPGSSTSGRQPSMLTRLLQSFGGRSSGQDEGVAAVAAPEADERTVPDMTVDMGSGPGCQHAHKK